MKFFVAIASLLLVSSTFGARPNKHDSPDDPIEFENELQSGSPKNTRDIYTHGLTLECDYAMLKHYWGEMYTCLARNLVTYHHYDYIVNATGEHMSGKGDRDVQAIYILGQRTPFIPYNLTVPFGGSVVALRVESSGLRFVNRTFSYEGDLQYIHFENNFIEEVPTWAFRNMTGLKWLSFRDNQIRYLESTLLHGMTKLRRFSVTNNRIEVVPSGLFHDTGALEEIYFYNNKIRMVGWKLVNFIKGLKVAAFRGNPCTGISIYNGDKVVERLTAEFKSKCAVDCRRADAAAQEEKKELKQDLLKTQMCAGQSSSQQNTRKSNSLKNSRNTASDSNSSEN